MNKPVRPVLAALRRGGRILPLLGFLHLAAPLCGAAVLQGESIVVLEGALPGSDDNAGPFHLHITWKSGQAVEAWGEAYGHYNSVLHEVRVIESHVEETRLNLRVEATLKPDMWVKGGKGTWELSLGREPSDGSVYSLDHNALRTGTALEEWHGEFSGAFEREEELFEARGKAPGNLWALPGEPARAPITHAERPRILLRRDDLAKLRERMESPLGQAIMDVLPETAGPIGPALLYALTGDRDRAAEAAKRTRAEMSDPERIEEHETHQSTFWADRSLRAAIALDLCFDAWEEGFRQEVIGFVGRSADIYLHSPWRSGSAPITRPGSYKADKIYAGSGIGMLALWGLPGEAPRPPPGATGGAPSALQSRFGTPAAPADGRMEAFQRDRARWEAEKGANLGYLDDTERARRMVSVSLYSAVGEGGGAGMPYLYDFDLAWRNAFGVPVSSRPILSRASAEAMMSTVWRRDAEGHLVPHPVLASPDALNGAMFSRYFALADAEWRPSVLWYWLRLAGIESGGVGNREEAEKLVRTLRQDPLALFYALREAPDTVVPREPGHLLTHSQEDRARGDFWFRNAWEGPLDIVATLSSRQLGSRKPHTRAAAPFAGTFRLHGLGHAWVGDGHLPRQQWANRLRYNAVHLTDLHANGWAQGRVHDYRTHPHGASVHLDLGLLYERHEYLEETRTVTEKFRGNLTRERPVTRQVHRLTPLGIEATRTFAADFSGAAGVPAVFALADRVSGDHAKEWQMHVPDPAGREVRIEGNTFHIIQGDATLTGTFLAPEGVRVEARRGYTSTTFATLYKDYAYQPYTRDVLVASGPKGTEGEFLLLLILRKGTEAPEVTPIPGDTPGARVNGLHVHFGEQAITFTPPPGSSSSPRAPFSPHTPWEAP